MKKHGVKRRTSPPIVKQMLRWIFAVGLVALLTLLMPLVIDLQLDRTTAWASDHNGQSLDHGKGNSERGPHGKAGATDHRGGAKDVRSKILSDEEGDEDSDRPDWYHGNKEANPHIQGGGQPAEAGTKKGDIYGDLWLIWRDPVTGLAILDENGYVQPLIEVDGELVAIQLTEDGELPPEYTDDVIEAEFGRLSVGRSPSKVTEHALDEALSKLTAATTVSVDLAGRLVVDGATIDSPLENLALYIALMTDDPALQVPVIADKLEPFDSLTLAANLLAAAADKTGTIGIDTVAYQNVILDIAAMTEDDYIDYSTFDYNRNSTYSGTISYYFLPEGAEVPILVNEPILQAVFDNVSYLSNDGEGITDFAQAADDALQMIEFIHTQIHEE